MFNPLQADTVIPTGTSGIIPTGAYLDSVAPLRIQNPVGQIGGATYYTTKKGKEIHNRWIAFVYKYAEEHGISYSQALKLKEVPILYRGGKLPMETVAENTQTKRKRSKKNICLAVSGLIREYSRADFKKIDSSIMSTGQSLKNKEGTYDSMIYVPEFKEKAVVTKLKKLGLGSARC
jgi:hypothetical protein